MLEQLLAKALLAEQLGLCDCVFFFGQDALREQPVELAQRIGESVSSLDLDRKRNIRVHDEIAP
jgi:hypothetical protein